MNYTEMSVEELESRMAEISSEIDGLSSMEEVNERSSEVNAIKAELEARKAVAAKKAEMRAAVAAGAGTVIMKMEEDPMPENRTYTVDSAEYRSAFLKTLLHRELNEEEQRASAYVATTTDTTHGAAYILPTTMLNRIWDLVEEQHALLGDITMYRTGTILSIPMRSSISQGDAKNVSENAANDDEINEMTVVTLNGKDFSKTVKITYAMAQMSIESFEDFLVKELADRIGAALAVDVKTQVLSDYDDDNNAVSTATADKLVFTDVAAAFAKLKNGKGSVVVYANNATIFGRLVGMVDTTGRPVFQVNANDGPAGYLIGAPVKEESSLADDVLLIGYPECVVGNTVQDILIESTRDIEKHNIIYSGYARFECKLVAAKAFATLTVTESP